MAVIVTASHNPAEFNGLKCIAADGLEVSRSTEQAIEEATEAGTALSAHYTDIGTVTTVSDGGHQYVEGILGQVDVPRIRKRKLTVVLDCGNGASVETSPALLRGLGCRVVTLNGHLDGTFPGHPSEPTEANTRDAQRAVPAVGADFGVIHDGDCRPRGLRRPHRAVRPRRGDPRPPRPRRSGARSRRRRGDAGLGLAEPGGRDRSARWVGLLHPHRLPAVTHAMVEQHAVFGGEENGGIITPRFQFARDGAMTLASILDFLARAERPLAELLVELPHYALVKERIPCPIELRPQVVAWVGEKFQKEADRIVTIDGVKVFWNGGWMLLRPSGTEPLLRLFAEAKDPKLARQYADSGSPPCGKH